MSEHHKDASVRVAQALFDQMAPAEQADVQAEADRNGVSIVGIMRRSLDILIAASRPSSSESRVVRTSGN